MSKDASVKPKMPTTMHFFNFDQWLGTPYLYMDGGEAGGDELDKVQARDIKSKEAKLRVHNSFLASHTYLFGTSG